MARSFAPGESGRLLQETIRQGSSEGATAAVVGLIAASTAGTLALAQLERSANRLAGSNDDRPGVRRYLVAARLALTVGVLLVVGTLVAIGGGAVSRGFGWTGTVETTWGIARWPIGAALVLLATYLLFRRVPRERVGARGEVFGGALVSLALWIAFSAVLALYFAVRSDAGENPYGPLLAVIALLLWSMLSSLAFHLGMSTVCELAGARKPDEGDVVRVSDVREEADPLPAIPSPS
jgi:membrane protein